MNGIRIILGLAFSLIWAPMVHGQDALKRPTDMAWTLIPLNDFSAFGNPDKNWSIGSDVSMALDGPAVKVKGGQGTIINAVSKGNAGHLVTKQEFGDIELELDFMMAKGSNSGIYLQGRYEVQLFDSWKMVHPTFGDCGGIYQRWDDSRPDGEKGYEGMAPIVNASLAPGLWQNLRIRFKAPRFNGQGKKMENAVLEQVYLNGVLVQQQMRLGGPTRSSLFGDEGAVGPLMFQGDHGNVAFRNIRYRVLSPEDGNIGLKDAGPRRSVDPILLEPGSEPYILRSFLEFDGGKRTHVVSIGNPDRTNFSYDLKQGSILQVWRGNFVDATGMWEGRGEAQLARPLGAVIRLSSAPSLAILDGPDAHWPDSVPFDRVQNKGYILDRAKNPTFEYVFGEATVSDKISPSIDGESLTREIQVSRSLSGLYFRLAQGKTIEPLGKGRYAIDGSSYYIEMDKHIKPILRKSQDGEELILAFDKKRSALTYSIIW